MCICFDVSRVWKVCTKNVIGILSFLLLILVLPLTVDALQTALIRASDGEVYQIRFRNLDPNNNYDKGDFIDEFSVYNETGQVKLCPSTQDNITWELYTAARAIAQTQRHVPVFDTSNLATDLEQSVRNLGYSSIVDQTVVTVVDLLITDTALEDLNVVSILTGAPSFLIRSVSLVASLGSIEIKLIRVLYAYSIASRYATIAQHLQKLANHHAPRLWDAINAGEVLDFPIKLKGKLVDYSDETGLFDPLGLQLIAQVYQDYAEKAAEYGKVLAENPDALDVALDVLGIGSFLNFIDASIDFLTDKSALENLNTRLESAINGKIFRNIELIYDDAKYDLRWHGFCSPGLISGLDGRVYEGYSFTDTVVLKSPPESAATVTISSNNPDVTFSPAFLTFTSSNWYIPQSVTVSVAQDNDTQNEAVYPDYTVTGYGDTDPLHYRTFFRIFIIDRTESQMPDVEEAIDPIHLTLEGSATTIDVAQYFSSENNLSYEVESNSSSIATASVSGSVITITPVAAGVTTVVVTARDTVTNLTAIQTISVSVRQTGVVIVRPPNNDQTFSVPSGSNPRAEGLRERVSVITQNLGVPLRVREGPGTNYNIIELIGNGLTGIITDGPRQANGYTWWEIEWDSGNLEGWSVEAAGGEQILFRRPPDLEIRDLDVSDSQVGIGEEIELEIEIRNNGPGESAATDVYFYYSETRHSDLEDLGDDSDLRGGWTLRVPSIRESRTETLTYRVDAPTTPDYYYYGAFLPNNIHSSDNTDHLDEDAIRNNLAREERVQVVGAPDYIIESISLSGNRTTLDPGGSFTLRATVRNQGLGEPSSSADLDYYRSRDARISTSDSWVGDDSISRLDTNETDDESISLTAPTEPGIYYYGACVSDVRNETDRSNNCSAAVAITVRQTITPVEITGSPDLVVTLTSNNSLVDPNGSINLVATLRNQGDADASNSTTVRYYVSSDAAISSDDEAIGTDSVRSLSSGNSDDEDHGVRAPNKPGQYYYYACVDSVTDENDTGNNCSNFITITVRGSDLVVESVSVDLLGQTGSINPNGNFTLNATVRNQGTGNAASTTTHYYISSDQTFSADDSEVQTAVISAINIGVSSNVQSTTIRSPYTSGFFYCFVCVDALTNEIDTDNNCSDPIKITVRNVAPRARGTITAQTLNVGTPKSLAVSNYFVDDNNDTITYSVNSSNNSIATATTSGAQVTITPKRAGSATITVTANDGTLTATQIFSVSVVAPNRAPVAVGTISGLTLTVGESAKQIDVLRNFNDTDNDILTYTATSNKGRVATASVSGSQIIITPVGAGTATITVIASDGKLTATQTISVTVTAANSAPVAVGTISGLTLTVGESAKQIDVSRNFNDPENDTLTYTATSNKGRVATASVSGSQIIITPVGAGTATITVTASDGKLTATQTISVTVTAAPVANRAPVTVGAISARTLTVGDSSIQIEVSSNFQDPDSDTLTYTASSNSTGVANASASGSNVTITPVGAGTATITVTARDNEFSATQTISVTVTAAPVSNLAPVTVGAISDRTLTVGDSAAVIDVSSNFNDPDDDTLEYTANSDDTSVATASATGSQVTITPVGAGSATITVEASDGKLTATQTISVTVTAAPVANLAPVTVGAISDRTLTVGDSAAVIDVSSNFNDPDNDTLTYSVNSNNTNVATASATGSQVTITPVSAGSATITVTASDSKLTATQNISVVVTNVPVPNRAPVTVGAISARTLTVGGSSAVLNVLSNFEDPDGDSLSYTVTSSDTNVASVNVSGARVTITPNNAGSATITVTVSDGEFTATQTISITVTETPVTNLAPVTVGSIPSQSLTVGGSSSTFDVSRNFSDPDGNTMTYTASSSDTGVVSVSISNSQVTITPVGAGSATITVTASDGTLTATQTISVSVAPAIAEETWMPDSNLRTKVRSALGLQSDEALTQQAMAELVWLTAVRSQISDLTGLEYATNLTNLTLYVNDISDITPLENLTTLTNLQISGNQISDITPLENLTALTNLNLRGNEISDITALENLTALPSINIGENQITDITPLENLSNLTSLYIGDNLINDITPLENLTGLTYLSLGGSSRQVGNLISDLSPLENLTSLTDLGLSRNQISDITPLENLTALTSLSLYGNQISDISPLESLTALTHLRLEYNQISDVSPLENLTALTELRISNNPITDYAPLRRLKEENPNVSIDIDITVDPNPPDTNNPPVIVGSIPSRTLTVGDSSVVIDISSNFEDADDDSLRYRATSGNTGIVSLSLSGSQVTITAVGAGIAVITVSASDAEATARLRFSVTVGLPNRAPIAVGSISSRTITVGGSSAVVDLSSNFNDPDDDDLSYTATSSDTGKATVSVSEAEVTISPVSAGSATITVTASDGSLSATQTISVTVTAAPVPNRAPVTVGSIPSQTLTAKGSSVVLDVSSNFDDPDDDNLSYTVSSSDTSKATVSVSNSQITITPGSAGSASITVIASDGELTASQTISVTVTNSAPVAIGRIPALTLTGRNSSEQLDVSAYFRDPNNDTLTYTVTSRTISVATVSVSGSQVTITAVTSGRVRITVTASDGEFTATQTFSVTIENSAPVTVGTIADQTLTGGNSTIQIDVFVKFRDHENDSLTYTVNSSDTNVATVSVSIAQVTITPVRSGNVTITVTASDDEFTASQTISVTVTNSAPVTVGTISAQTLTVGGASVSVDVSGNFSDLENDDLTYTASSNATGVATVSVSSDEVTITPVSEGSAAITVIASDGALTVTQAISVTVAAANLAPVAVGTISDWTLITEGSSVVMDVSNNFSDPNEDSLTYSVSSSDTSVATVSVSGAQVTITPLGAGSATITVTASDGTLTATQTFSVSTIAAETEVAWIPDANLRAKVRAHLGLQEGEALTQQAMVRLTILNAQSNDISKLTGLEHATNLVYLSIGNNRISDLTPLEDLTNLTRLYISQNYIRDTTPLEDLTDLRHIDLNSNQISNISGLRNMTGLGTLPLFANNISDLTPLEDLTALTELNLGNNQISDLTPLEDLTTLTELNLGSNQISDITPLEDLTALTELYLFANNISDLTPLEDLTALTELNLGSNQISDITPLEDLTALTELRLYSNQISDITPLENLTALSYISIRSNQISDVSALEDLTALQTLILSGNPITDYGPLRRLVAAIEADGRTLSLDITIPPAAPSTPATPTQTTLLPNYPNPFNPETWIPYQLAKSTDVTLTFYNVQGVVIRQLALGHRAAGVYYSRSRAAHWDGKNNLGEKVAGGVYFVKFKAGNYTKIRKMLIRK